MLAGFEIRWDDEHDAVMLRRCGASGSVEAEAAVRDVVQLLKRSRARHGFALMLVDVTAAGLDELRDMTARKGRTAGILDEGDRVALVVGSSMDKAMLNRVGSDVVQYAFFLSRSAAETWLFAPLQARRPEARSAA